MHQQVRVTPRVSSPASLPQTNPARTNNQREGAPGRQSSAGSEVSGKGKEPLGSPAPENAPAIGPPADSVKKLDQIVQNFYTKAAVMVLSSRMKLKPALNKDGQRKTNKWFQIDTDEVDDFRDELKVWRTCGSFDHRPPPMVVETYLDTSRLKENQSLVVLDEEGKRWDVLEQLNSSGSTAAYGEPSISSRKNEVILERWTVRLDTTASLPSEDFGPTLPTAYKKAIVFFRSLFITTRLLPCWKFATQGPSKSAHPALMPRCRIRRSDPDGPGPDLLRHPIDGRSDPVTEYIFGDLDLPVGRLSSFVTYRNDCSFRIDDSEALLSSRFMGVDENFFQPSLQAKHLQHEQAAEVGSLRSVSHKPHVSDIQQTYGSLSTFHGDGPLRTSPLSALRAVKPPASDTESPSGSLPVSVDHGTSSPLSTSARPASTRPPLRSSDGSGRRPSVSFQPFKAGSLSGSPIPRPADSESPASPHSLGRGPPSLQQARNRTSLTAGMPASLRGGPAATSDAPAMGSSPRQASTGRYSSSFTHRRGRASYGGTSRTGDDEQLSSGRQSLASSVAQPGSGLLTEASAASSGSFQGDDNNISEFLKMLDSKRSLKSFEASRRGDSASNRTVAQLSKFHGMKESNNALTESMTSSMQMHRSSSSSSRQLASVPGMAAPASYSVSSSPGKPMSPHTPHTPAIPSRLSENSIADDSTREGRGSSRQGRSHEPTVQEVSRESTITQEVSHAIDIPLSPRLEPYQRRSSSVAQQSRATMEDDDVGLAFAAHRSISLGAGGRERPTMGGSTGRQRQLEDEGAMQGSGSGALQPAAEIQGSETSETLRRGSTEDNSTEGFMQSMPSSSPFGRRRYTGMAAAAAASRRHTPPQSSRCSFTGSLTRAGRAADDESINDEPLVFDLSEMDAQGRRSTEEGRSGGRPSTSDVRGSTRRGW